VNEVRSRAVDIAVEAAGRLLAGKVDQKVGAELFKTSLRDVRGKLN
jgi:F-type H+-transporting ATPase subunit b